MSAAGDDVVHGLRAAARVTGRSPSGIEKLVDTGRLSATKVDGAFVFARAALDALPPPHRIPASDAVTTGPGAAVSSADTTTGVHTSGTPLSTGEPAPPPTASADGGTVASQVFADLADGHTLVQIVVDRKLSPDVVQAVYTQWRELSDVDGLAKPTSLDRLAAVERLAEAAAAEVGAIAALENLAEQVAALTRGVSTRLTGVERRNVGDDVRRELAGIRQRLSALEQTVRALPATPLAIGVPCSICGHQLAVAASCSGCGAGRAGVG